MQDHSPFSAEDEDTALTAVDNRGLPDTFLWREDIKKHGPAQAVVLGWFRVHYPFTWVGISLQDLGQATGLKPKHVRRAMHQLFQKGLILREPADVPAANVPTRYRLVAS